MNNFFTNNIGAFYPIDTNGNKAAYFNFQALPSQAQVTFNISVMAYNPHTPYQFHLTVYKDNYNKGNLIVDMYVTTNPGSIKINPINSIENGLNSTNFSLTTPLFPIASGTHTYEAHIDLLDMQGNKLDENKTWFLTRQQQSQSLSAPDGGLN
ncbi:hypothetical protein H5R88_08310 [Limosilactobacillus sp. WF-MT5-A]|uniref:hypothetical protein n=1 Tax=Limosilactobacillus TaxID=2742598 RepID=UPI0015F9F814|nr:MULTISPECIES: hypothetical protein [Limosilactobacillus]MBB1100088.1 hypothetical protein [Limosilactobacillus agrestis]MCD7127348.1 hypothetical protein [Limosilactobacillus agrestis]